MRRNAYRRREHRHSFVASRLGRLQALGATVARSLLVAVIGVGALAWFWGRVSIDWFAGPLVATVWQTARATRTFRRRGRRVRTPTYHTVMPTPAGVMAAVADLAPRLALRSKRLRVVVQEYGKGKARDLNLAAAAGWLGGGLIIVDDDLARKSIESRPGDSADTEVRGVIAHELGHIYGLHSILAAANAFSLAGVTTVCVASLFFIRFETGTFETSTLITHAALLLGGLVVCWLTSRWVGRMNEYAADIYAMRALRHGDALAAALAHDFGTGRRGWREVFDSHPSQDKRLARLAARSASRT